MFEHRSSLDRRAALTIALGLCGFLVSGVALERSDYFVATRDTLRGLAGPAGLPNDGALGEVTAAALARFGVAGMYGQAADALPSSLVVPDDRRRGALPIVSVAVDDDYLNDPRTGIMANMREVGAAWERPAFVSLWEDGELVVGSRIGLRMHGDSTRFRGDPSFRLMFRPQYGTNGRRGGRLLGPDAAPAAAIVIHVVRWRGHYPNVFVFSIAERLGLPTADFRPVEMFLNGRSRGPYVLTERVTPDGWGRTHFGDLDFFMNVYKGETKAPSRRAHEELAAWLAGNESLSMIDIEARVDVDNLTRHLITLMFSFTTDWAQGAALFDRDRPDARWFWLHWDMDQSFDIRGIVELEAWQQPVMELITLEATRDQLEAFGIVTDDRHDARHRGDIRRQLFLRLLEDGNYRRRFVRTVTDVLNHELTPAYLQELLRRYAVLEAAPGVYSRVDLGDYFLHRPDFVRSEVARYFGIPEPFAVEVGVAAEIPLQIDGYPHLGSYQGRYYAGQTLTIDAPTAAGVSHWLVNGTPAGDAHLQITIGAPTRVEAVFDEPPERR